MGRSGRHGKDVRILCAVSVAGVLSNRKRLLALVSCDV